jgi:Galactose mutarotase and related enzymes
MKMSVTRKDFGQADGKQVYLFTLANKNGMSVSAINYGCQILRILAPDKERNIADVVLGFDNMEDARAQKSFLGVVVGRFANRIGKSRFTLHGKTYNLYANDNGNTLHGGKAGFDKKVWVADAIGEDSVEFHYMSPDGEENYPGNLDVTVTYKLTDANELVIRYKAKSDADTVVNLTNHSYFNLAGHDSGSILDHYLKLDCDAYTPADAESIPTGEIVPVAGTPMDFQEFHRVGERIDADFDQLKYGHGYDHNWVINPSAGSPAPAATLWDKQSGRKMDVLTTMPGVQFYAGNFLDEEKGKGGHSYARREGLCLETQYYPDSINKNNFPSPVLKAGEVFDHTTVFRFYTE